MYVKVINGIPKVYSIEQLRRDNPQTSFPSSLSAELLAHWNVYPVKKLVEPSYNSQTHYLKQSDFYQIDGNWHVHYTAELLPRVQVEQAMRGERDRLLAESDWIVARAYEMQNQVPGDWLSYRQKLRDVPTQQNFPYEIIWPTKPE